MASFVIAPRMGARFSQYLAVMEPGGTAGQPPPGVERVLYVLEGQIDARRCPARASNPSDPAGLLTARRTPTSRFGRPCHHVSTSLRSDM